MLAIARFLQDERGRRHDAVVAKLPDQPMEPVSRRPRRRGDEDIDAKRSRPSIGKPVMGHIAVLGSPGCKLPRLPMTHASELDILHHFDDRLPAESPKHLFETLPDRSDQGPRAPAGYGFDSLEPS